MLHYGAATQAQFDIDAQNPADEGLTALAYIGADDIHVTDTDMTADLTEYGLTYTGSTLVCRTTALLRHYYRVDDQEKFNLVKDGITINGEPVEFKSRNGEIYFEIRNISAAELDADQTLKIGTNEYKYSAMDYAKRALRASEQGSTLWNLATALYWYNQAANIYFV